jgi:hypothetical protein
VSEWRGIALGMERALSGDLRDEVPGCHRATLLS